MVFRYFHAKFLHIIFLIIMIMFELHQFYFDRTAYFNFQQHHLSVFPTFIASLVFRTTQHLFIINANHHSSPLVFLFIPFLSLRCPNPVHPVCLSEHTICVFMQAPPCFSPQPVFARVFNCLSRDVAVTCRRDAGGDLCEAN